MAKARQPGASTKGGKTAAQPASSTAGETPHFCFLHADRATRQPWAFKPNGTDAQEVMDFACEMARLSWREIEMQETGKRARHKKHHSQPITSLAAGAQADLGKRKLDEIFGDEIFRFRLSGEKRLWGFRRGRVFHAVFWDPDHKVYESEPD